MPADRSEREERKPFGLILAGGRAQRMGGGDKGLLSIGGRTIIERILERIAPQCDGLAISAGEPKSRWSAYSDCILPDPVAGVPGPLAGILAGLLHLENGGRADQLLLTVPGDCPFLPQDLVLRLVEARTQTGSATALAVSGGRAHPLAALWPVALRPRLEAEMLERGTRRVRSIHDVSGHTVAVWPTEPLDPFFNVNTPADLAEANRLARTCGS